MHTNRDNNSRYVLRVIYLLLPMEIAFFVYSYWFFEKNGHLPAPFFYNYADTFMDFFNTNYWAFRQDRFTQWHSIYPIFVFLLSKIFTTTHDIITTPVDFRARNLYDIIYLAGCYLAGAVACAAGFFLHLRKMDIPGRILYATAWFMLVLLSMPGLFALERGNYILVAFMFLACSSLCGLTWLGALFLALAINVKQYLLVLLLVPIVKRRYDFFLLVVVFAIIPNLLGLLFVPEYHYGMILKNMAGFSATANYPAFEKIWFPTSLAAWYKALAYSHHGLRILGHAGLGLAKLVMALAVWGGRLLALAAVWLCVVRGRRLSSGYLYFIILLCLFVVSDAPGGYSLLLLFPFVPSLFDRLKCNTIAWITVLLFIPAAYPLGPSHLVDYLAFLGGRHVVGVSSLTLCSYSIPIVLVSLLCLIIVDIGSQNQLKNGLRAKNIKEEECVVLP